MKGNKKGGAADHRRSPEILGKQGNGIESLLDASCTERQGLGLGRWESLRLGRMLSTWVPAHAMSDCKEQGTRGMGATF